MTALQLVVAADDRGRVSVDTVPRTFSVRDLKYPHAREARFGSEDLIELAEYMQARGFNLRRVSLTRNGRVLDDESQDAISASIAQAIHDGDRDRMRRLLDDDMYGLKVSSVRLHGPGGLVATVSRSGSVDVGGGSEKQFVAQISDYVLTHG